MKTNIAGLMVAGLVSATQLPGVDESNNLQEQIAEPDFDRELQGVWEGESEIDIDVLDEEPSYEIVEPVGPEDWKKKMRTRMRRWQKKSGKNWDPDNVDWRQRKWDMKKNWREERGDWNSNKKNRWNKYNKWNMKKNRKDRANKWNKKRSGGKWGGQKPNKGQMMGMMKSMKELGPCAPIVQKTMMACFFVADKGVRREMGAVDGQQGDPMLLTSDVNKGISEEIGQCYHQGLNELATCLKEQNSPDREPSPSEDDDDLDEDELDDLINDDDDIDELDEDEDDDILDDDEDY